MTPRHQSQSYSEEQANGGTKPGIVKKNFFRVIKNLFVMLPGGWVTQAGGAVTLDQVSILSAPSSSLEIKWSMNGLHSNVLVFKCQIIIWVRASS